MSHDTRGTKRHCSHCGANFYDLNRAPIVCPKCHADYVAAPRAPSRSSNSRPIPRVAVPALPDEAEAFAEDEVPVHDIDEDSVPGDEDADEADEESLGE